jgi:hypothetical protein
MDSQITVIVTEFIVGQSKKAFWKSKAVQGAFLVIVTSVFGLKLGPDALATLQENIFQIASLLGAGMAIKGRVDATQPLGWSDEPAGPDLTPVPMSTASNLPPPSPPQG